jgi:hypothetical protein
MVGLDVPEEVRVALKHILAYTWRDECAHAAADAAWGSPEPLHIFYCLLLVYNWLYDANRTAEECFKDPAYPDPAWPDAGKLD